ncbi:MAG TPA: hypothetical protein VLJ17_15175 [Xanthobacteraceae bacterium]|nr:hypothetical protein [Xanthobacteraceae bacterium]
MGVSELRSAFNDIAEPAGFTCSKAELSYEPGDDIQWQRLTFRGTDAAGVPFVVRSERLRPETSVIEVAKSVATQLIAGPKGTKP